MAATQVLIQVAVSLWLAQGSPRALGRHVLRPSLQESVEQVLAKRQLQQQFGAHADPQHLAQTSDCWISKTSSEHNGSDFGILHQVAVVLAAGQGAACQAANCFQAWTTANVLELESERGQRGQRMLLSLLPAVVPQ
jgi:hypothetical protein